MISETDQQPLTRREARARLTPADRRRAKRAGRQFAKSIRRRTRRPGTTLGSKLFSLGALLFAGAMLVGMSVPTNVFIPASALAAPESADKKVELVASQSLAIPSTAPAMSSTRDTFDAISYAQVLTLKYAGVDYTYSATSGDVRWPFPYAVPTTDGFGSRDGGFHKGVDFVPGAGAPIYAIADGVVTAATYDDSGYGQHVVIQHNLGGVDVESLYAHMIEGSSPISVGQEISVGDYLGLVGDTGIAYGAHLHFEIHVDKVPVDPYEWLEANAS